MTFKIIQLGKNGITENFIEGLKNRLKNSRIIKISVLRSATRDREELIKLKDGILEKLGTENFTARIIGFTIALKKLRK